MNVWLIALALPLAAGAVFTIGYHVGLKRSSETLNEVCEDIMRSEPVREATIKECIEAVGAIRPLPRGDGQLPVEQLNREVWLRQGVDDALDALVRMDKRDAGHYGVPRDIMELRSRMTLVKAADKEA